MWRLGGLFDRDAQSAIIDQPPVFEQLPVDHAQFGYLPGVAQVAQMEIGNPNILPQPPFSRADFDAASWFTTRSVLSPLGNVG